jgi:hypothetical protein
VVHPEFSEAKALVRVEAAMTIADDFARTPHLRSLPWIQSAIHQIGVGVFALPAGAAAVI